VRGSVTDDDASLVFCCLSGRESKGIGKSWWVWVWLWELETDAGAGWEWRHRHAPMLARLLCCCIGLRREKQSVLGFRTACSHRLTNPSTASPDTAAKRQAEVSGQ
jgi:hypothetical protein